LTSFDELPLVELIVKRGAQAIEELPEGLKNDKEAMSETIENNIRRKIVEEEPVNPKYYEKMSKLLDELIKKRRADAFSYEHYLQEITRLARQVVNPEESGEYPERLNTKARRALFDNLEKNEELALAIDKAVRETKRDDWKGDRIKEREVKFALADLLPDERVDEIFELVKNQQDY